MQGPDKLGRHVGSGVKRRVLPAITAAGLALASLQPASAGGEATVEASYRANLGGFALASGTLTFSIGGGGDYEASIAAQSAGLASMFANRSATAGAAGKVNGPSTLSRSYSLTINGGPVQNAVAMSFSGGNVTNVSATELRLSSGPDARIPILPEHKRGVVDPLGAFVVSVPGRDDKDVSQKVCGRTLKVFDGRVRYDLRLVYGAKTELKLPGGSYSGPAIVCAVGYRPIAGFRPLSPEQQRFERNMEFSIWFVPVGTTGVYLPAKVVVGTQMGLLTVVADRFVVRGSRTAEIKGQQ